MCVFIEMEKKKGKIPLILLTPIPKGSRSIVCFFFFQRDFSLFSLSEEVRCEEWEMCSEELGQGAYFIKNFDLENVKSPSWNPVQGIFKFRKNGNQSFKFFFFSKKTLKKDSFKFKYVQKRY